MTSSETFEEWYENEFSKKKGYTDSKRMAMYGFVQLAWNHQQEKIDTQNELIEELVKVVEFYVKESDKHPSGWVTKGGVARKILQSEQLKTWRGE